MNKCEKTPYELCYADSCFMIGLIRSGINKDGNLYRIPNKFKCDQNTFRIYSGFKFDLGYIAVKLCDINFSEYGFKKDFYEFIMRKWRVFNIHANGISYISGHHTYTDINFDGMSRIIDEPSIVIDWSCIKECALISEENVIL